MLCCTPTVILFFGVIFGLMYSGALPRLGPHIGAIDSRLTGFMPAFVPDLEKFHFDDVPSGSLDGKVAIVTGANIGLGYWTSHHLARKGASVVMACRTKSKCEVAAEWVRGNATAAGSKGQVFVRIVDVSSLASVAAFTKEFKETFKKLDIFVANAGIGGESSLTLTVDGIESIFATNHLGHFKMYKDLEDLIVKTAKDDGMATVVAVSSAASYDASEVYWDMSVNDPAKFSSFRYYSNSKLANILFIQEVNARVGSKNVYANAAHPGIVASNIFTSSESRSTVQMEKMIMKTVMFFSNSFWTAEDGAKTQFYLAANWPELQAKGYKGQYFHQIVEKSTPGLLAANMTLQKGLWEFSEKLLKERGY